MTDSYGTDGPEVTIRTESAAPTEGHASAINTQGKTEADRPPRPCLTKPPSDDSLPTMGWREGVTADPPVDWQPVAPIHFWVLTEDVPKGRAFSREDAKVRIS